MSKMNALKKKAAVKKFSAAYKENPENTQLEMTDAGYSEEEIFEITEAIMAETDEPGEKKSKAPAKQSANSIFEKWTVAVSYQRDEDGVEVKDKYGRAIPVFEKVKQLRTVKITDAQAQLLNSQSVNSLLRYYAKD